MPPDGTASTGRSVGRRDFLRAAGAAGAAATAAAGAGCTTALPPLGRRVRFGRIDAPARGEPRYRSWLPGPSALRTPDDDPADALDSFMYMEPGSGGAGSPVPGLSIGRSLVLNSIDYLGVGFENYDWALTVGPGAVLHGDVDRGVVADTLTGTVYERVGSYRGFDLYDRTDGDEHVAASGTHVVATSGEHAAANARAVVDAGRGRARRYHEVDDALRTVTDAAGASPFTWFGPTMLAPGGGIREGDLEAEPITGAISNVVDEGAVYFVHDTLFPAGAVPTEAAVKRVLESNPRALDSAAVDITIDDPIVTVEMRMPLEALRDPGSGSDEPFRLPHVTWQSSFDRGNATITVRHLAGDEVETRYLRPGGTPTDAAISAPGSTFGPGEELRIDVSGYEPGDRFRLVYAEPSGDTSATIFAKELDDVSDNSPTPTTETQPPTRDGNETAGSE